MIRKDPINFYYLGLGSMAMIHNQCGSARGSEPASNPLIPKVLPMSSV